MNGRRTEILDWVDHGHLRPEVLPSALRVAGITPGKSQWRNFFDNLSLWLGVIFLAASVIFFFAYNWQALGRFAKFGLVELLIVASLLATWRLDQDRMSGRAALLVTTLLTGALFALIGQTYQTGADTFELFAVWALAVFPLAAVGRFGALWLFWIGLINLALIFYHQTFGGFFGVIFNAEGMLWSSFALNTLALCAWEIAARQGVDWLQERVSIRILVTASGGLVTTLALWAIFDSHGLKGFNMLAYLLWLGAAYAVYRLHVPDLFVLAGGVLSIIAVVTAFLGKHLLRHDAAGGFLLIGLIVIGLSAAGGFWLKSVAKEERA